MPRRHPAFPASTGAAPADASLTISMTLHPPLYICPEGSQALHLHRPMPPHHDTEAWRARQVPPSPGGDPPPPGTGVMREHRSAIAGGAKSPKHDASAHSVSHVDTQMKSTPPSGGECDNRSRCTDGTEYCAHASIDMYGFTDVEAIHMGAFRAQRLHQSGPYISSRPYDRCRTVRPPQCPPIEPDTRFDRSRKRSPGAVSRFEQVPIQILLCKAFNLLDIFRVRTLNHQSGDTGGVIGDLLE